MRDLAWPSVKLLAPATGAAGLFSLGDFTAGVCATATDVVSAGTPTRHEVGSSVWQVFEGDGSVVLGGVEHKLGTGDLFAVPSWVPWSLHAGTQFDLFRFSDAPVIERLNFAREGIVDDQAVVDAIDANKLHAYALQETASPVDEELA